MSAELAQIKLKIDLDDDPVDLRDVIEYIELFQSALRGIVGPGVTLQVTRISRNSPLMLDVLPVRERTSRPLKSERDHVQRAISNLRKGKKVKGLTHDAVRRISTMTRAFVNDNRVAEIQFDGKSIELDETLAIAADNILGGYTESHGAITGRLQAINIRSRKPTFRIYSEVPPYRVTCVFKKDLLPAIIEAIGEVVDVEGLLKYRKFDAFPFEVSMNALRVLRPTDPEVWLQTRGSTTPGSGDSVAEVRSIRDSWSR